MLMTMFTPDPLEFALAVIPQPTGFVLDLDSTVTTLPLGQTFITVTGQGMTSSGSDVSSGQTEFNWNDSKNVHTVEFTCGGYTITGFFAS